MARHADVERRVDSALIAAAGELHNIDVDACGLADLGRPDGFAQRQVAGWRNRWERAAGDSPASRVMEEVAADLARSLPRAQRAAIVHNDLKLDNCLFDAADPDTVASVLDWDMATLGDPLFDLGSMVVAMRSLPVWVLDVDEAVGAYAKATGMDLGGVSWYLAFATWRSAVVMQQLANRYRSGDSKDERLAAMEQHIPATAELARSMLA
jgi:aminoglycoside phosphotransferase (APT) family kinase protein